MIASTQKRDLLVSNWPYQHVGFGDLGHDEVGIVFLIR